MPKSRGSDGSSKDRRECDGTRLFEGRQYESHRILADPCGGGCSCSVPTDAQMGDVPAVGHGGGTASVSGGSGMGA